MPTLESGCLNDGMAGWVDEWMSVDEEWMSVAFVVCMSGKLFASMQCNEVTPVRWTRYTCLT